MSAMTSAFDLSKASEKVVKAHVQDIPPVRIAILGSTRGTALQPTIDAIESGELNATIVLVVSNREDAPILERANKHKILAVFISGKGKTRDEYDAEVSSLLVNKNVDLVLLIGYMRILSAPFVKKWENRVMNVHPSLLPAFAGGMDLAVHKDVLKSDVSETGCTIHMVTEVVDGGPIVIQKRCAVLRGENGDTPETLKARVQALEGPAFIEAIHRFGLEQERKQASTHKSAVLVA